MNVAVLPHFRAVFFAQYLYQQTRSAIFVSVSKRMSISVWPPRRHLVVVHLDPDADRLHRQHHVRPDVWNLSIGGTGK